MNETLARRMAGRRSITGERIRGSFLNATVAGVVADFKDNQLDAEPPPQVYMAYERAPAVLSVGVTIRTVGNPWSVALTVRKLISGTAVGTAAALALTRLMASLLYNVKASDPDTFVAVAGGLALDSHPRLLRPCLQSDFS